MSCTLIRCSTSAERCVHDNKPASYRFTPVTGRFISIAPSVCERLLGEPSSRSSREWRWGRKGSFRLKLDTGTWSDFEAEEGGECWRS